MRIIHVSDCYLPRLGGIERHVDDLARRQQAAGHDVEIVTSVPGQSEVAPVLVHRPSGRGDSDRILYRQSASRLGLLRAGSYDVVHVHVSIWSPQAVMMARAACACGLPVAATVHSLWHQASRPIRLSARLIGWRRWPVAWSAVSNAAARPVLDILGHGPVSVVPNGIDRDAWTLPHPVRDPKRVVIASVMRLVGRKRPQALLAMLAALRACVPDEIRLEAVLIGDGPQRAGLAADARRLGMTGWVTLPGAMSRADIRERYRDVDLYVAPATLESFGIAALEARCAGLPVIAYRRTGIADFIDTEVNGLLVDDDRSMIEAMRRLSVDGQLRAEIACRNHMSAPAASWDRVLADCEQLYQRAHALSRADRPRVSIGR